ncbi:NAD(P)-binding domain-containing protein [Leptospira interrogans]
MPTERIDTLVIGGGQAGLVMSYRLKQRGIAHLVLERARIAERWRSERWDGLKFQFPNWSVQLPNFAFPHSDPDAFATSAEIVKFIDAFAEFVAPPIRCGVEVTHLKRGDAGFIAETADGTIEANSVVVATGPYQQPLMPDLLRDHPVFQVHASGYKNPDQLPPGAVLVVGAGASGAQIADELHRAGRRVFLSVGQHTRMPRRYRGQDLTWWFGALRLFDMTAEQRGPIRVNPSITGAYGGYTIDFRRFAAGGITLLGRVLAARDGVLEIAAGLAENLANGDLYYAGFLDMLDAHVEQRGLDLPADLAARTVLADPLCVTEPIRRLDLGKEDVHAVIWATGYGVDFSWIDLPVRDDSGEPVHRGGVSEVAELYFLGLPYLSKLYSAFLSGVGDDAAVLADHIAARR